MCLDYVPLSCLLFFLLCAVGGAMVILLPILLLRAIPRTLKAGGVFRFASYYADHMVLQKEPAGAILWGYGKSDATVTMYLYEENNLLMKKMTQVEERFRIWKIVLNPMSPGGPYRIEIQQSLKGRVANVSLNDVYFGDVWLCSGQSNMEMTLLQIFNASKELADAPNFPLVRVFAASRIQAKKELQDLAKIDLQWSVPTAANPGHGDFIYFSAVCWLFGRSLFETVKYPIGLVESFWGGSAIEAWSSKRALRECGLSEKTVSKSPTSFSGPRNQSVLWNAMIHPLLNMTLRGAIWYQGETNTQMNTDLYNCTFPALIEDWRKTFHEGSEGQTERFFPFGFVQLSAYRQEEIDESFPHIRWHQTADFGYVPNRKMPNTFMAVAIDLGDDKSPTGSIHPRDKQSVAYRLHLGARAVAYGEKNLTFQGPYPQSVHVGVVEKLIKVTFGQKIKLHHLNKNIFEVCCSQASGGCTWKPVPMTSSSSFTVTLQDPACSDSVAGLRYAWTAWPCEYKQCPIYNLQMLPAPPFITFSKKDPGWIMT
ncbi:sialate O-acetylesterase [Tiliqua scincoides]|uniref:sialate O-acetylesterase n=1 Tax=Tiliqua scincoides TaxID=71010 RepID=UPI0034623BB2